MQLAQDRILLQQAVENIEVRAPAPGIVLDLPLVAVGSIVQEGDEILTLVQTNGAIHGVTDLVVGIWILMANPI